MIVTIVSQLLCARVRHCLCRSEFVTDAERLTFEQVRRAVDVELRCIGLPKRFRDEQYEAEHARISYYQRPIAKSSRCHRKKRIAEFHAVGIDPDNSVHHFENDMTNETYRDPCSEFVPGNVYDKYRTKNPAHRWLMRRFLSHAVELASESNPVTILEVGCGSGDLAAAIIPQLTRSTPGCYTGIDLSETEVAIARERYPDYKFEVATAERLPFADHSFDLVIACEVLEHVTHPEIAMSEIARVSRSHALVSVPWEPYWQILNCLRGKYLSRWGNTPGHVNHFSRSSIRSLAQRQMQVVRERRPFPWTMLLLSQPCGQYQLDRG